MEKEEVEDTVLQGKKGDMVVMGVEYKTTSTGRQKFGGTINWPQFPSSELALQGFYS